MSRRIAALTLAAALCVGPAMASPGPQGEAVKPSGNEITMEVPFSTFMRLAHEGKAKKIKVQRGEASATTPNGLNITARTPPYNQAWVSDLLKEKVEVSIVDDKPLPPRPMGLMEMVSAVAGIVVPIALLILVVVMVRSMAGGGMRKVGSRGDGKSLPQVTTFSDVAGAEEAKDELSEIVAFLKDPSRFDAVGARTPRGVLLVGDPGNGKTLLAKAVAGEAGVPFHFCSGSDFVEMFVGLGARRVRTMFKQARKPKRTLRTLFRKALPETPAILFIDEIDAVGRKRSQSQGGAADREHDQTLNALLTEMDGMGSGKGLVVIAATNRIDVLDPALLRSGRFDRHITVAAPGVAAREEILKVHTRKVRLAKDVDLAVVAKGTPRFSGADLEALVNEAALEAAKEGLVEIGMRHLESARDRKLLGGAERRGGIDALELRTVAFHEAGHALAAVLQPECDPVHKATIVPRGQALGFVARLPERDQVLVRRSKLLADLVVAMGGRAAEEAVFGPDNVTGGAASDIHQATNMAREMVARYGLGSSLTSRAADSFAVSEETRREVDREAEALVQNAYATALGMMTAQRKALDALAEALLERETMDGEEVRQVIRDNLVEMSAAA